MARLVSCIALLHHGSPSVYGCPCGRSDFKECVKDAMRQLRDEGSDTGKQVISRAHMCEIEDVLESATVPLCQSYPVNLVRNWSFEEASVVTSGYVWTTLINYWYTSAPNLPVR